MVADGASGGGGAGGDAGEGAGTGVGPNSAGTGHVRVESLLKLGVNLLLKMFRTTATNRDLDHISHAVLTTLPTFREDATLPGSGIKLAHSSSQPLEADPTGMASLPSQPGRGMGGATPTDASGGYDDNVDNDDDDDNNEAEGGSRRLGAKSALTDSVRTHLLGLLLSLVTQVVLDVADVASPSSSQLEPGRLANVVVEALTPEWFMWMVHAHAHAHAHTRAHAHSCSCTQH